MGEKIESGDGVTLKTSNGNTEDSNITITSGKEIVGTFANEENNVSLLDEQIIRQIEYYFGDMNLPRDKFLQEQIKLDDGWVPFTTMFKFKRLAALTTEPDVVISALSKSESQLMEVSEDKTKIRRSLKYPLPEMNEERRKELVTRTLYVKGFPKDATTIDTCLSFFKKYNPCNIVMRRYEDKKTKEWHFKGSIFVTFRTVMEAEKFLNEPSVKFEDDELIRKWQAKYIEEKQAEALERNKKKSSKAEKQKQKKEKEDQEKQALVLPLGAVLILEKVPEEVNRDRIKDAITELGGNVAFVKIEDGKAWVRMRTENTAKEILEKCKDGKITVENIEMTCSVLEGDEEKQFLDDMASEMSQRKHKNFKSKTNRFSNRKRKNVDGGPGGKKRT